MNRLDPKLLILVGATVVAGLLGARSVMTAGSTGDSGFGGVQPLPLGVETDDSPPLDFDRPASPRNPFADARQTSFGGVSEASDESEDDEVEDGGSSEP